MSANWRALLAVASLASLTMLASAAEIAAQVTDQAGQPVADAIVVAAPVDWILRPAARHAKAVIDQIDKQFSPRVKAIYVGTSVSFPNKDNIRHHVYSFSSAKRFELPLYAGTPARRVVFDKPGVVVLGCNIHDWMVAYLYVSASPYFAKTAADGKAMLRDLPARSYTVRVWHPELDGDEEATSKAVDLAAVSRIEVLWALPFKTVTRLRHVPTSDAWQRLGE